MSVASDSAFYPMVEPYDSGWLDVGGLTTVARCGGCDDVLFRLDDESWAIVHLTWTRASRERAPWPRFTQFGSFIAVEMTVDAHSEEH